MHSRALDEEEGDAFIKFVSTVSKAVERGVRMTLQSDLIIPGAHIPYWHYKVHLAKYIFAGQFVEGKEVLDVGCGVGYGSHYLLMRGATRIVGVDISEEAIQLAIANFREDNLDFTVEDATSLPFAENSFDSVICIGMIDHVPDPEKVILEARRVLRDDGVFLCSVINKQFIASPLSQKPLDPYHKIEFTPTELFDLTGKYFSNVKLYGSRGSRAWYQIWCIANYLYQKLRITNSRIINQAILSLARVVFPSKYKPVVYNEDDVDLHFPTGSGYFPIHSIPDLNIDSFAVIGTKESQCTD